MIETRLRRLALVVILALIMASLLTTACKKAAPPPSTPPSTTPVVQIPPPDVAPNGCPDCHKVEGSNDYTLPAEAKKAAPNHPTLPATADVNTCLGCHGGNGKNGAPPFHLFLHKVHLTSQTFSPKLHGYCNSCHVMNADTGNITVKGVTTQ